MRAASLKNWYSRRARALSPGPPLRVTRAADRDPVKPPKPREMPPHWWNDALRKRQRVQKEHLAQRLRELDAEFERSRCQRPYFGEYTTDVTTITGGNTFGGDTNPYTTPTGDSKSLGITVTIGGTNTLTTVSSVTINSTGLIY